MPTSKTCASFKYPNGAVGEHNGQPTHKAHAPVTVTMRPITVTKNTATNTASTNLEKDDLREYFILFLFS
jgi:hypothetical protein